MSHDYLLINFIFKTLQGPYSKAQNRYQQHKNSSRPKKILSNLATFKDILAITPGKYCYYSNY